MERRQIGLKLALDQLGLQIRVETFEDRLILQKAVHLAQAAGVNLGYYFRWYLHGPYCPAVAEDGFCIAGELAQEVDDSEGWTLDEASSQRLAGMRSLVDVPDRSVLAKKLELLASVHFLIDRKQVPGASVEKIAEVLKRFGKDFGPDDVQRALGELRGHAIIR
jgi:hypothetical protein